MPRNTMLASGRTGDKTGPFGYDITYDNNTTHHLAERLWMVAGDEAEHGRLARAVAVTSEWFRGAIRMGRVITKSSTVNSPRRARYSLVVKGPTPHGPRHHWSRYRAAHLARAVAAAHDPVLSGAHLPHHITSY